MRSLLVAAAISAALIGAASAQNIAAPWAPLPEGVDPNKELPAELQNPSEESPEATFEVVDSHSEDGDTNSEGMTTLETAGWVDFQLRKWDTGRCLGFICDVHQIGEPAMSLQCDGDHPVRLEKPKASRDKFVAIHFHFGNTKMCLDADPSSSSVKLSNCNGSQKQGWKFHKSGLVQNELLSDLCMSDGDHEGEVVLRQCSHDFEYNIWTSLNL